MKSTITLCGLAGLLAVAAGCSTFNRDWDQARAQPIPTRDLSGPWDGGWQSERNAHHGRLRCLMTREADDLYQARFRARFWKIFSYGYSVPLQVHETNGHWALQGQANLGKLAGGAYSYEGQANPTNFFAWYSSQYDHGIFEMRRPEPR